MWFPPTLHRKWGGFMLEGTLLELLIASLFANVILATIAFTLIIVLTVKNIKENHIYATE